MKIYFHVLEIPTNKRNMDYSAIEARLSGSILKDEDPSAPAVPEEDLETLKSLNVKKSTRLQIKTSKK